MRPADRRGCRRLLFGLALMLILGLPLRAPADTVTIGWTAWSDAEFVTRLAGRLIEKRLGHEVELTLLDIALQYQGVARGDLDLMLMAWLPETHADYWERYGDRVDDLGVLYAGARLGWVVPGYVPRRQLAAIPDLGDPGVASRLHREIFGIDPGAGLMRLSEQALQEYGLEHYSLIASSGAAMTAMIERAHRRRRWIVVTAWRPHWMFHTWKLRFLEDPRGVLGGEQAIHALARTGLARDLPEVTALIRRMSIPLDDIEAAIARAQEAGYEQAVDDYIESHGARIRSWLDTDPTGPAADQ